MRIIRRILNKIKRTIWGYPKMKPLAGYPFAQEYGIKISHISAFANGNMGDKFLPIVLRNLFNNIIGIHQWNDISVYEKVDRKLIKKLNQESDLIVIGGGGLFLKDTNPNKISGWQWACSLKLLDKIEKPIVAFALGYNRFRGQEDFDPIFTEHLNAFVEKAAFVGIRNHGSIEKLKGYLKSDILKQKLLFQPCMTTLTSLIYPNFTDYRYKEDFIALNCAFDRQALRNNDDSVLFKIAHVMKALSAITKIKVYAHAGSKNGKDAKGDAKICPFLDAIGVPYEYVCFSSIQEMFLAYSRPRLVIGMRGHAQMIPFGCNTPILSIISHDKMQWFLDDINHPEWGVDINEPNFQAILETKAKDEYANYMECMNKTRIAQERLWVITKNNMAMISSIVEKNYCDIKGKGTN